MSPSTVTGLQEGVLEEWNDERGFGFIRPLAGGPRAFVHVSAFGRARRPVVGSRVAYAVGRDERGRTRATEAHHLKADAERVPAGLARAWLVSLAFFVVLLALVALGRVPTPVPLAHAVLSAVAGLLFRTDKAAAVAGRWRTAESTLLVVVLVGGWPGALVARHAFRHKTTKQPFRILFWCAVVVHCLALAAFAYAGSDVVARLGGGG